MPKYSVCEVGRSGYAAPRAFWIAESGTLEAVRL